MSSQYFRFTARADEPRRSRILERLLARADGCRQVTDWRADAFQLIAPDALSVPAISAAVLCADRGAVEAAWVCLATPVHYVAEMNGVRLAPDGMPLTPAIAATLAADFNRLLGGDGVQMIATKSAQLVGIFDRVLDVMTHDPQDIRGRPIEEYLPAGADSARLRLLMSEMEMWLFEHEINKVRTASGQPALNGLWFWGGGAALRSLPRVAGWTAGDDPFFAAFSAADRRSGASGVIAVDAMPGSSSWHEAESRWLAAAGEQLEAGRIAQLKICANDRCYSVSTRGMRRFWRRSKPWTEYFE